jgi:hypothetical protein
VFRNWIPCYANLSSGILDKIPKKLDPPLQPQPGYVDGWGLHVVEGLSVLRLYMAGGFCTILCLILYIALLVAWKSRQDAAATAGLCFAILGLLLMGVQLRQREV